VVVETSGIVITVNDSDLRSTTSSNVFSTRF
jgi:hypothetical protein